MSTARPRSTAIALTVAAIVAGCDGAATPGPTQGGDQMTGTTLTLSLRSTAFAPDGALPRRHAGEGEDRSPPLSWGEPPDGTAGFALICDDPDAPTAEPWVHWLIYNIPAGARELPEGIAPVALPPTPAGAIQGVNSWGRGNLGYRGPAPPRGHGVHHYRFRLYALDAELALEPGIEKAALLTAMQGHVLAEGELVGTYERP
jgi:Raf kinase inhibitor-like YbhB/YbcL family protein